MFFCCIWLSHPPYFTSLNWPKMLYYYLHFIFFTSKLKTFTLPSISFLWSIKRFPVLKPLNIHKSFLKRRLSPLRIARNRCKTSFVGMAARPVEACSPNEFASRPNYFPDSNNRPPTFARSRFQPFKPDLPFSMFTCSFQGKRGYGRKIRLENLPLV